MQHILSIDEHAVEAWLSRTPSGFKLLSCGKSFDVALKLERDDSGTVHVDGSSHPLVMMTRGDTVWLHIDGAAHHVVLHDAVHHHAGEGGAAADDIIRAPMPGAVIAVHVESGSLVSANDPLMIIESMKLETVIKAQRDGIVEIVGFSAGQSFDRDAVLIQLIKED